MVTANGRVNATSIELSSFFGNRIAAIKAIVYPCSTILMGLFSPVPAFSQPPVPEVVYFAQSWCPSSTDLEELANSFALTMNRCCIFKAEVKSGQNEAATQLAERFRKWRISEQDLGACVDENSVEAIEAKRLEILEATKRAIKDREQEVETRRLIVIERRELPAKLRARSASSLCVIYGELLRDNTWIDDAPNMRVEALGPLQIELRRRSLVVSNDRVKTRNIRVGDSECHLFAAWGTPPKTNRTVTGQSVIAQHVYSGRLYVYTNNGKITAWQD